MYNPEMTLLNNKPTQGATPYVLVAAVAAIAGSVAACLVMGTQVSGTMHMAAPVTATRPTTMISPTVAMHGRPIQGARRGAPMYAARNFDSMPMETAAEEAFEGLVAQPKVSAGMIAGTFAACTAAFVAIVTFVSKQRSAVENLGRTAATTAAVGAVTLSTAAAANAYQAPAPALFAKACAACHIAGNNLVIPGHTLSRTAMEKYLDGGWTKDAIEYQIRNGKGPMPAWEGVLTEGDIAALRDYVYDQSTGEWADVE